MTKEEVERIVLPEMPLPPGAYTYWWENLLIAKTVDGAEGPCLILKEDMVVEVVDEEDLYKLPTDDSDCDCGLCAVDQLVDTLREILDDKDNDD